MLINKDFLAYFTQYLGRTRNIGPGNYEFQKLFDSGEGRPPRISLTARAARQKCYHRIGPGHPC